MTRLLLKRMRMMRRSLTRTTRRISRNFTEMKKKRTKMTMSLDSTNSNSSIDMSRIR